MKEKTVRCVDCGSEFTDEEIRDIQSCPTCSSDAIPCAIKNDVTIRINLHELRILTIWASNWAAKLKTPSPSRTMVSILSRLRKQLPEGTCLTIMDELNTLQDVYPNSEVTDSEGNVILPPKKVQ